MRLVKERMGAVEMRGGAARSGFEDFAEPEREIVVDGFRTGDDEVSD